MFYGFITEVSLGNFFLFFTEKIPCELTQVNFQNSPVTNVSLHHGEKQSVMIACDDGDITETFQKFCGKKVDKGVCVIDTLLVLILARTNFRAISRRGPKMCEI